MIVGAALGREPPWTPDYDGIAARIIQEGLGKWVVGLDMVRVHPTEPALEPPDGPLVKARHNILAHRYF